MWSLGSKRVSLKEITKLVGNFVWVVQAIPFSQSHYKALQRLFISESSKAGNNLSVHVSLDEPAKENLKWWIAEISKVNGKTMTAVEPYHIIASDASLSDWGLY